MVKKSFKKVLLLSGMLLVKEATFAQMLGAGNMAGTGMQYGMMGCPYKQEIGEEAESIKDTILEKADALNDLKEEIKDLKSEKNSIQSKIKMNKQALARFAFKEDYLAFVVDYVDSLRSCNEFDLPGQKAPGGTLVGGSEDQSKPPAGGPPPVAPPPPVQQTSKSEQPPAPKTPPTRRQNQGNNRTSSMNELAITEDSRMPASETGNSQITVGPRAGRDPKPFTPEEWGTACDSSGSGRVFASKLCAIKSAQLEKSFNLSQCTSQMTSYLAQRNALKQNENELALKEAEFQNLKFEIADLKGDYKREVKEYQRDQERGKTESDSCFLCDIMGSGSKKSARFDLGGVVTNVALGLGSIIAGSSIQKYAAAQNARLGIASQTYPSFGYGYPFFANAAAIGMSSYGAVNGGVGNGAFGCASVGGGVQLGGQVGGAFGYPPGYVGTPGFGGGFGMGVPGMNGMGMGNMGMNCIPGMGCIGGQGQFGFGGNMGMGIPGMNGMGMGNMGMNCIPGMGCIGGQGQFGFGGGFGMGVPGMNGMGMGNMGMNCIPGMGCFGGQGQFGLGGNMGMGIPGMNGMGNMGMGDMSMMNMQLQLQQKQMEMQMQQYKVAMEQQQRAQENYMNGSRVIVSLQQELQSVQMRLQQAVMSLQSGGYLGVSGSIGGSITIGTPSNVVNPGVPASGSVPAPSPSGAPATR